jgi:Cd2+/Zn2+-exporting ATPase
VSIPLSFFSGLGGAGREGILIKGSNYLEALSKTDTVVLDNDKELPVSRRKRKALMTAVMRRIRSR